MSIFQAREWWSAEPDPDGRQQLEGEDGSGSSSYDHMDSLSVAVSPFPSVLGHDADALVAATLGGNVSALDS